MYHVTALRIIDCLAFEMWHSCFGARRVRTRDPSVSAKTQKKFNCLCNFLLVSSLSFLYGL